MSGQQQERLRQLLDGYRNTILLYTAAKLGLAEILSSGAISAFQLARQLAVNENALQRFLRGLQILDVVRQDGTGNYSLTTLGEELRENSAGKAWAILAGEEFLPAWRGLIDLIRTGEPAFHRVFGMSPWEHRQQNPELGELFNACLQAETARLAESIVQRYDFSD